MSINMKTTLRDLQRQIEGGRPKEAEKWVEILSGYFDDNTLTSAQIDFGIGLTLSRSEGSLAILESCLNRSDFTKTSVALMQLYLRLIQEFNDRVKSYAAGLCKTATTLVCTSSCKAVEKEVAIQIIRELIERKFLPNGKLPLAQLLGVTVGNLTERFAQKLFQTIGLILCNHPDQVPLSDALHFRQDMLSRLEKITSAGNNISFLRAAGAIDALRFCFFNYPPDIQNEPRVVDRVYGIIKKFCERSDEDRGIYRSALRLFKDHVALFGRNVLRDADEWHMMFVKWLKDIKSDDKEFVVPAVYALYGQLAGTMMEDVHVEAERKRKLLTEFLNHFKCVLRDPNSKPFQIRLAVRSFGILSVPVKGFLPPDVVGDLVSMVIAHTNYEYFSEMAEKRDKIQHLPDYILTISLIVEHMEGIASAQMVSLEKFIVALMQDFHYLSANHHRLVVRSLINSFQSMSKLGGTILEDLLGRVMLQGILWACSHKLPMETYQDDQTQDWKQNITFRNYLPLWSGIVASQECGLGQQKAVKALVGDTFLKCLLIIIRKLDLTTIKRKLMDENGTETEASFCDPDSDLVPRQASDFLIFFNLVNFYQEILMATSKEYRKHHLRSWFSVIAQELVVKSYEYPLVSGYMKLMELLLKITYSSFDSIDEVLTDDLKKNLIEYFKITIAKAKGSSGELQLTSLKLLFKAPDEIVLDSIEDMADVFELGFSIGKSVLWLAESALTCLERNVDKCSDIQKDALLRRVLPLFDNFLLSQSVLNTDFGERDQMMTYKSNKRRGRINVKPSELPDEEMDLRRVQKRIILFLGTLEPDQCLYMISSKVNQLHLTKWDIDRNVKLSIFAPDKGIQPELLLDNLIPRVFHLAKSAADRQTKLAACELVHGITLYVIGHRSMNSRRLWREIYQTMFALACDADTAVQQMFEPLMVQVMHFKARPEEWSGAKESGGTLVEVIMSCLSDPKDPALRDVAAKGLRELLSWTLELTRKKNEVVRTVIKDIVGIITFNSVDYNIEKRLGAALAFNNIYRILRENELIIDLYWLMFLSSFCTSLWLCDQSKVTYGMDKLVEQVENCLDHVLRVIVEKTEIFRLPNEERQKPESFSEANLGGAIEFVFQLTYSRNSRIRKKAQAMFLGICEKEYSSISMYFDKHHTESSLNYIFDKNCPTSDAVVVSDASQTLDFLQSLIVANETHRFLFGECQIRPQLKSTLLSSSRIFRDIKGFLSFLMGDHGHQWSLSDRHQIMAVSGNLIEELLRLLDVLSEEDSKKYIEFLETNTNNLVQLSNWICFADQDHAHIAPIVTQRLHQWIAKMSKSEWAHLFVDRLMIDLKDRVTNELDVIKESLETILHRDTIPKIEVSNINGILVVQKLIGDNFSVSPNIRVAYEAILNYGPPLAKILFECCKEESLIVGSIKQTANEYANQIMKFCLSGNYKPETVDFILEGIISQQVISTSNNEKAIVTVGQIFLSIFRERIFEYIISSHRVTNVSIIKTLFSKVNSENVEIILKVMIELTEYVFKFHSEKEAIRGFVCDGLEAQWKIVLDVVSTKEDSVTLITDYVSHIGLIAPKEMHLVGKNLTGFESWLLTELQKKASSLDVKCKVLSLMPIVAGSNATGERNLPLLKALNVFKVDNIPLASSELKQDTPERAMFVVLMRTLLDSLRISKSLDVFEFLIAITSPDEQHIMEGEIRRTVSQMIQRLDPKLQLQFLNTSFQLFQKASTPPLLKLNLFRRFIKTIMRSCDKEALKSFYETLFVGAWERTTLGKLTLANLEHVESHEPVTQEPYREVIRDALVNRIVGFYLLELLYGSLELADMDNLSALVQFKKNTQSDKTRNMLTNLTKTCFEHTKEPQGIQYKHEPLNDLFRKYKCCAYRALCTIIMSTTVEITLYNKAVFSKDIWKQIIGTSSDLFAADFVSDFEDFPRVKERIISMKTDVMAIDGDADKFKSFNTVFSSSLSQDVTKIDFTSRLLVTETRAVNKAIKLEDLAMNNHEVMPTFCAIIQHMFEKKITTSTTPEWINSLFKLMYNENRDVHNNIRLFVGRLVENCKDLLQEYASTLFKGVLKVIADKCSGSALNVYCMDLFQMLIQWNVHYKPESGEEKSLMAEAVKFLVDSCHNENSDVMKLNLEIVRLVVVAWKDVLSVPVPMPYDLINPPDFGSPYCGLQLIAIFLTNDLPLWTQTTKSAYIEALVGHLYSDCNKTYKTAAQVIGYFLNLEEGAYLDNVLGILRSMQKKNANKFVDILYAIHVKYPDVVAPFKENIYNSVPTAIKTMRIKYLTLLLAQTHPLKEIVATGLLDMLKQREYQLYILHVINKSIAEFTSEDCDSIVHDIIGMTKSDKHESRLVAYEVLCKLLKSSTEKHKSDIRFALISGFRDSEETVQNLLLAHWSTEGNLPAELSVRFCRLAELFEGVAHLDDFLEFNSQLLLDSLIREENSTRQLLSAETEYDNKLSEYEINVSWRTQNLSKTIPLFARSLNNSFVPGQSTMTFKANSLDSHGNLMFEPTQDMSVIRPTEPVLSIPTQSSFIFNARGGTQLLNKNSMSLSQTADEPFNPLKKRLIRDREKAARNVAVHVMNKRGFEDQRKLYKRRDQNGKIVIYRRYRFGDFPDFLINYRALLLPLQALAIRDQIVARKVFVGLFQSLVEAMDRERVKVFCDEFCGSIKSAMDGVKYCNANVYGSFMELSFYNPITLPIEINVNMSIHNNTPALAALVLESKIASYDVNLQGPAAKRRPGGAQSEEQATWMRVAELYKATKDSEIVSGIFAEKLESDSKLTEAIELERNGRFKEAQGIYADILRSDERLEMDYCFEAMFNCYLEMGRWDDSVKQVTSQMGDWEQLWTDEWNREYLLPNMMQSQVKLFLDKETEDPTQFLGILDKWLLDKERNEVLKMDFPEELIVFNMIANNKLGARVLTEDNIRSFANEWGHLSVLSENIRHQRLLDIRIIAELDVYLDILVKFDSGETQERFKSLLGRYPDRWASSIPQKSDSLMMWDFLFSCRRFIGTLLYSPEYAPVVEANFCMHDRIFKLAVAQRNSAFAGKMLAKMKVMTHFRQSDALGLKVRLAQANNQILKAELKGSKEAAEAIKDLQAINTTVLQGDMANYLPTVLEIVDLMERAKQVVHTTSAGVAVDQYVTMMLQDSIDIVTETPDQFSALRQTQAIRDIHAKLAQYSFDCLDRIPQCDMEDVDVAIERERLQKIIVTSLLDSLRYESEEGQKLFPSILRFKKQDYLKQLFTEKCRQVPVAMLLKWIPQLLSHVSFEKESYLDDLLLRIAKEFPVALYFPFQLSYDQFKFQIPGTMDRPVIAAIKAAIYNPKMGKLVNGLSTVCLPQVMFMTHVTNLQRSLKIKQGGEYKELLLRTIDILWPEEESEMRGRRFRGYNSLKKKFTDLLEFVDANDTDKVKSFLDKIKKQLSSLDDRSSSTELEDLCPWLATYSSVNGASVEIPGQYTDYSGLSAIRKQPLTIMKFGNKIDIFGSKTRPVKINIYGSDGQQYNFLLKYGEDLRQDQRIQQIFKLMSDNLAMDKHSQSLNLNIVTYNVVPITTYFGMLSWVPDTVPLQDFVQKSLAGSTDKLRMFASVPAKFKQFLQDNHKGQAPIWEIYANAVERESPARLRTKFRELCYEFPPNLLRQAIVEISASPESFFVLRNNFARTMAAMNIAHWILGVGDRHLLNILMNVKTCNLIGIDFNVVFESGCRILPIPELIPFRLTPQFVQVMSPFGVTGVIRSAMINTLRVFRSEKKLLQTCLEVFLREPTIDWLYNAIFVQDDEAEFDTLSTDTRVHWEPSDRLMAVKDKLEGANPVQLIVNGLEKQVGYLSTRPNVVERYANILRGETGCVRNNLPRRGLTVDQQVKCLIDLATDEAVLGITFIGLFPWL